MRAKSGFTLVEILIVVVILGILAAIVIPQFTNASTEAKESALASDLQSVRSQVELYKIQHNDNLPGVANGTHIAGSGFASAMTTATDQDGAAGGRFGPYMQKIPANPFNDLSTVEVDGTAGNNDYGWNFVTSGASAGLFQADDDPNHSSL
jgi:general secretion pathway protein G